jgi:hypothetical protein
MFAGILDNLFGSEEKEVSPPDPARDRELMLEVLFGRAAPSANKVVGFLGTPRGQQALGVLTVTAGVLLIPKVMR